MRPNLFIIGAPKCGTSSLFDWLVSHPQILGTRVKEPFFLTDPAHPLARRPNLASDGIDAYATLFPSEASLASIRLEATTHYFFDPVARDSIAAMPDARVLLVLREPAMRIYSSFRYSGNNLARLRPGLTFQHYLDLLDTGRALMPEWCSHPGSAYVLERELHYSRYHLHLAPWLDSLGRNRVKVILMERMIANPAGTVTDILAWLGLDPAGIAAIDRTGKNRTREVRLPTVQAMMRRLNAVMRPPEVLRRPLKKIYGALQFREDRGMSPSDADALARLRVRFVEDNIRLSRMLDMDLSAWSADEASR